MNSSVEYGQRPPPRRVLINKHTVTADTVRLVCGDKGNRVGRVSFEMSENARGSRAYKLYKIKGCPPWIACCESSSFWLRMRGGDCIGYEFASLRASFECESGLHSSGIMHHLATLENVFGKHVLVDKPAARILGMKFSDCILFHGWNRYFFSVDL